MRLQKPSRTDRYAEIRKVESALSGSFRVTEASNALQNLLAENRRPEWWIDLLTPQEAAQVAEMIETLQSIDEELEHRASEIREAIVGQ